MLTPADPKLKHHHVDPKHPHHWPLNAGSLVVTLDGVPVDDWFAFDIANRFVKVYAHNSLGKRMLATEAEGDRPAVYHWVRRRGIVRVFMETGGAPV